MKISCIFVQYWSASDGIGQAYQRHLATILAFYKDLIAKLEKEYGMTFTGAQPTGGCGWGCGVIESVMSF